MKRIISLTSIPPRFDLISDTLNCLVKQNVDEVRLYIPQEYSRFCSWDGSLPEVPQGVTIVRCDKDLGPATKVLYACRDFKDQDVQILFCDDDCIVDAGWSKGLFNLQSRRSDEAIASYVRPDYFSTFKLFKNGRLQAYQIPIQYDLLYRFMRLSHKLLGTAHPRRRPFVISGYGDVLFGVGGVVVRPSFFDDDDFEIPSVARMVDDIWLSAMLARKGIKLYCPAFRCLPRAGDASNIDALVDLVTEDGERQTLNYQASVYCRDAFGVWN